MGQCVARKRDWSRCKKHATSGRWFCSQHRNQPRIAMIFVGSTIVLGAIGSWVSGLIPPLVSPQPQNLIRTANIAEIVSELQNLPITEAEEVVRNKFLAARVRTLVDNAGYQMSMVVTHEFTPDKSNIDDKVRTVVLQNSDSYGISQGSWSGSHSGITVFCRLSKTVDKEKLGKLKDRVWSTPVEGFVSKLVLKVNSEDENQTDVQSITLYDCTFPEISF